MDPAPTPRGVQVRPTALAFALLLVAASALASAAIADGQPPRSTAPPASDTPPFPHARSQGDLRLALPGLETGAAQMGGGERIFGVCWQGGSGPYHVRLMDSGGRVLVDEAGVGGNALTEASKPVRFTPGTYAVEVSDSNGLVAAGRFAAIDATSIPGAPSSDGSPQAVVTRAASVTQAGLQYRYEAYLEVLPWTISPGDPQARRLAAQLCRMSD